MPWNNAKGYLFNAAQISSQAPAASGVYALYTSSRWIYFGESGDLRKRLTKHLKETNTCIKKHDAATFSYELCPAERRVVRQNQLILEYRPPCNKKLD